MHHGSSMKLRPAEKSHQTVVVDQHRPLKAVLPGKPASPRPDMRDKMELTNSLPQFLGRMFLIGRGRIGKNSRGVCGIPLVGDMVCITV